MPAMDVERTPSTQQTHSAPAVLLPVIDSHASQSQSDMQSELQ